ncbi:MAG: hypothetical protein H0Z19_11305 [Archaeoglobus sp.]|uniref:hypothetical protein n=1 Tax=Archaeoglobus sp. TaxID=1872626 RepID=UPI001D7E9990|nr:hypothetical protein [Archaeoglobus sp.]MBO8181034.1 hypothetical protein [Archaeoglobus sp.]
MGRPATTFEYFQKELARYGLELKRVRVGRGFFNICRDGKLVFTARDYRELRAFLLGLDYLSQAEKKSMGGVNDGNEAEDI